ncbi:MAG: hypothetical protein ABW205_09015 [Burkholderiales bacterium]
MAEQLRPYGIGDASAARKLLDPMRDHLSDAGLGSVSEIFDGAPPHVPREARERRTRARAHNTCRGIDDLMEPR